MSKKHFTKTATPSELNGISKFYDTAIPHLTKDKTALTDGKQYVKLSGKQLAQTILTRKLNIKCKTKKQKEFLAEMSSKEIVICSGPAGVGKSYLSIAKALDLLIDPDNNFNKIYLVVNNQVVDDEIGFLKGSIEEKLAPFLYSTYYIIDKLIGKQARLKLQEYLIIENLFIGHIRGLNIDESIVIVEETQNLSTLQIKTLVTRIGYNSRFLLNGDLDQVDRKDSKINGLQDAINKFSDMEEFGIIKFENEDIVRNPLISKILSKY